MNEQTKHIAAKCWDLQLDGRLHFDQEKFAELLVKECIKEIKTGYRGDFYTGDLYDCEHNTCIDEQVTTLEEYFGVNK
tara:strand:- start:10 stop:243 length:234 start_codon:yes stop_codon:yes gene_type:complete